MAKQDEIIPSSSISLEKASEKASNYSSPVQSEYPRFEDRTISVRDWAARTFDDVPGQIVSYFKSLFPIATWIYRYNLTWLTGDVCIHPIHLYRDFTERDS